jgi:hypothetical protein
MRGRPSPALVVAGLALVVACSGTSYAVSQLPAKSVGTVQLQRDAVTGAKVKNGTLSAKDFRRGALPAAAAGLTGPVGPAGPRGPEGPRGPVGPSQSGGAWAARTPNFRLPADFTPMFSLVQFANEGTGPLTLERPSRLVMHGVVEGAMNVDVSGIFFCRFEVQRDGVWVVAGPMSPARVQAFEYTYLPLTAVEDVGAGVVDVRIACANGSRSEVDFASGSFVVVATDR